MTSQRKNAMVCPSFKFVGLPARGRRHAWRARCGPRRSRYWQQRDSAAKRPARPSRQHRSAGCAQPALRRPGRQRRLPHGCQRRIPPRRRGADIRQLRQFFHRVVDSALAAQTPCSQWSKAFGNAIALRHASTGTGRRAINNVPAGSGSRPWGSCTVTPVSANASARAA